MKGFFDTPVLVPVFYGDHVQQQARLARFIQFNKPTGCCGAHSLAEMYSTLTRMPGKHRISREQAMLFIGSIRERLIALSGDEYADALQIPAALGIACGGIYDALLAHCALKAKADSIYTWNHCCPAKLFRGRISLLESAGWGEFSIFRFELFQVSPGTI